MALVPSIQCRRWGRFVGELLAGDKVTFAVIPAKAGIQTRGGNMYYVYILASSRNGTLYIGMTNDLVRRVWEHKNGVAEGFTHRYHVDKLVYFETTPDVAAAIQREKQMKKWRRSWKVKLIEESNPMWRDLYSDMMDDRDFCGR